MLRTHFWKTYLSEWQRMVIMGMTLLLIVILLSLFLPSMNVIPFIIGFTLCDPFSYYLITYKREFPDAK